MGETYAMNGGDGAYSYTKNSQYQVPYFRFNDLVMYDLLLSLMN